MKIPRKKIITDFPLKRPRTGRAQMVGTPLSYNVPRICEVGCRPIWVKRSGTAYSLLGTVALRHSETKNTWMHFLLSTIELTVFQLLQYSKMVRYQVSHRTGYILSFLIHILLRMIQLLLSDHLTYLFQISRALFFLSFLKLF
jgi:hypothetical protein